LLLDRLVTCWQQVRRPAPEWDTNQGVEKVIAKEEAPVGRPRLTGLGSN